MIQAVTEVVRENPELLLFLALAGGYLLGKVTVRGFGLGTTAAVLLVAMALGQFGVPVPPMLKSLSFALFAFCIGYQVGPQFFGSLRRQGLHYLALAAVVALTGLLTAVGLGRALRFDAGTTAGLFAGAMTQSAVIGTAEGAVDHLPLSATEKQALDDHIVVAYAITYLFGTVGVILFFKLLPAGLRVDLPGAARRLEEQMGGVSDLDRRPELFHWSGQVGMRAYAATQPTAVGQTVDALEARFPARVAVNKIRRGTQTLVPAADTVITAGDILLMTGKNIGLAAAPEWIGSELDLCDAPEVIGESLPICVVNPECLGRPLREIAQDPRAHGLFVTRLTRQGRELPVLPETVLNKCDMLHLVGEKDLLERVARDLGYAQRPTPVTDLVTLGLGCAAGTLLGLLAVPLAGVPLTLGVGGGVLVGGLVCGWLRSVHPTFGQIPDAGQWLLNDLGLSLFVACVGLGSGKQAVEALAASGASVFLAGVAVALVPIAVGALFGRYVLRMNPVLLLGALAGARVIPAALNTLQADARSSTPALGFAAPFAFANVFLTVMGSVIIHLM